MGKKKEPSQKKQVVQVCILPSRIEKLKMLAENMEVTMSEIINLIIIPYLNAQDWEKIEQENKEKSMDYIGTLN